MKRIIYCLSLLFIGVSCSDKEDPIGIWGDIIKLSTKSAEFSAKADSVTIKTEGDWWWVNEISINDNTYSYYHRSDINLQSDHYSIKGDCFVVERRDKNTLFIKMEENLTGEDRLMTVVIEAGDYFDYVNIKQAAL